MDSKLLARIGAIVFVAIAITMTAIEMARAPEPMREAPVSVAETTATTAENSGKEDAAAGEVRLAFPMYSRYSATLAKERASSSVG